MSRRPSVFTTLSGSRYYMDETKGEPIPVPASIIHSSGIANGDSSDPNTKQIRRQSSQQTLLSNLSTSENNANQNQQQQHVTEAFDGEPIHLHYPNINSIQHQHSVPYPPPSMSQQRQTKDGSNSHYGSFRGQFLPQQPPPPQEQPQQQFRNPTMQQHNHPSPPQNHFALPNFHGAQPQRQQSSTAGARSLASLKSIKMLDRIPPPAPPSPPYVRGIEMNCKIEILSAPIGRRCLMQHQQRTNYTDLEHQSSQITSAFAIGEPIFSSNSDSIGSSASRRIPYHSLGIQCPKCHEAMIVSKFCLVVQCPQCKSISPCEATTLGIANPRDLQNTTKALCD